MVLNVEFIALVATESNNTWFSELTERPKQTIINQYLKLNYHFFFNKKAFECIVPVLLMVDNATVLRTSEKFSLLRPQRLISWSMEAERMNVDRNIRLLYYIYQIIIALWQHEFCSFSFFFFFFFFYISGTLFDAQKEPKSQITLYLGHKVEGDKDK